MARSVEWNKNHIVGTIVSLSSQLRYARNASFLLYVWMCDCMIATDVIRFCQWLRYRLVVQCAAYHHLVDYMKSLATKATVRLKFIVYLYILLTGYP